MTEKFYAFSRFFFTVLNREYKARMEHRSYNVKNNTFGKLQRLALDVVNDKENTEAVTEYQKEAVAFVLHIDPAVFGNFLCHVNGRYLVMNQFYPQCIAEFCYHREWLPVSEWASEFFPKVEETSETEETTEASETTEETAGASTTSDPVEWPTFSPVERFFDMYSGHLRAELMARTVGTHALLDSETFRELRAYAQAVRGDEETYFDLTIIQQTLTSAVASMASLRLFNRLHTKASSEALSRFTSELVGNDGDDAPEPKTTASEPEAKREGAEAEDVAVVPSWLPPSREEAERASVRLLDALRDREGARLLIIRPDDEPLSVECDRLLDLWAFDSRVHLIAKENEVDPFDVVRLLASAPLRYEDDPKPEERPEDLDRWEDDGGVPQWAKESPGPLTWTDILTAPLY